MEVLNALDEQFLQSLRAAFAIEAEEHAAAIATRLLELEQSNEPEEQRKPLEELYREVHSLKGAARAVSAGGIEAICQSLESLLDEWKRQGVRTSPEDFDVLHRAARDIRRNLGNTDTGGTADSETLKVVFALKTLSAAEPFPVKSSPALNSPPSAPAPEPAEVTPIPEPSKESPRVQAPVGKPQASPTPPLPHAPEANGHHPPPEEKPAPRGGAETVRLSTAHLDNLLLQAEEMLVVKQAAQSRSKELSSLRDSFAAWRKEWNKVQNTIKPTAPAKSPDGTRARGNELQEFLQWNQEQVFALEDRVNGLARVADHECRVFTGLIDNLLEDAKRLLTLPFSYVLAGMPLMVRDLARQLEKDAVLEMTGTEVQIDKRILEEIKDPLIHLLRNAVDHGVEPPEERERLGKPRTAVIHLDVRQSSGSEVRVTLRDDGRGIDTGAVVAAAQARGVLAAEDIEGADDEGALELIFASAVSTSATVTEISGRGLGMAIVREKVEKLGGRLTLETAPGRGTTFHLVLPLTLATLRGVLVETHGQRMIVPLAGLARALRVPAEDIRRVANRETVTVPGRAGREVLSLVSLGSLLHLPPSKDSKDAGQKSFIVALLLRDGDKRAAFAVDEVLGEQEVLIKPLAWPLVRLQNIAGTTLLSSGKVVPVLDTADLLGGTQAAGSAPAAAGGEDLERDEGLSVRVERESPHVLVVEDSITSRMLLKHILETAGYRVHTAVDGMDAVDILAREKFELVVSDVDMPRMDGFELTAHIRGKTKLEALPIVLVTARDSREDRERGVEVGANAYIVKSAFDQSDLLQVIGRLI